MRHREQEGLCFATDWRAMTPVGCHKIRTLQSKLGRVEWGKQPHSPRKDFARAIWPPQPLEPGLTAPARCGVRQM